MGRYPLVRLFSWTLMALGALTWALTGVGVVILLSIDSRSFRPQVGSLVSELVQIALNFTIWRLLVGGLISGISLMGTGQLLSLMIDMAADMRSLRTHRDRDLVESKRTDYRS